jgi:iron complex transport system substrate-binding protein
VSSLSPGFVAPGVVRAVVPRVVRACAVVAGGLLLVSCGATPGPLAAPAPAPAAPGASAPSPEQHTRDYSFSADNCGFLTTVEAPPERVLTIKSSTLEMMLALGLADRVVGAAFLDGPIPDDLTPDGTEIPVVSDKAPGPEAVLSTQPDLVYAGWESSFSAESAGDREALGRLGVATYVSPSACKAEAYRPDPLTFDQVFAEIAEAGALFGVPDAAERLVAEQRDVLAGIEPDARGLTALWYSSGSDTPYVGAGIGAPQMIMTAAGLTNIAAGVHDTWTPFSWEQVVADAPDVIVLVDAAWNSAEKKIGILEGNPVTAGLTAVREGRYLVVPFPATEAGVRNVDAAASLARQLAELDVRP